MTEPNAIVKSRLTPWPAFGLILGVGLATVVAGFLYDVLFAGIPYQDPTPELQAKYDFHSNVASWIMRTGLGICLLAIPVGLVLKVRRKNV